MKKLFSLLFLLFIIFFGVYASAQENISPTPQRYVADEVIVKFKTNQIDFKKSSGNKSLQSFATREALITEKIISPQNISVMKINDGKTVDEIIQNLKNDPTIEYVQPNFIYKIQITDPDDTYFNNQRGLKNIGQIMESIGISGADIQRNDAMDIWSGNSNITTTGTLVAIVDDGLRYNHPEFSGQLRDGTHCLSDNGTSLGNCLYGYDFVNTDNNPIPYIDDTHGTHIAGIIGAKMNNGIGIAGINPGVKIMAVKAGQDGWLSTSDIVEAINFAKYNGAKIINASRGDADTTCESVYDQAMYEVIEAFPGLFITAAGNSTKEHLNGRFDIPADYNTDTSCRSGMDHIITVAASTNTDTLASFSDYGHTVDIAAPGKFIASTVDTDSYAYMNGTSMATPFVVGVASLARSMRPELSYLDIKHAIIDHAEYVAEFSGVVKNGKRLNAYTTLLSLDNISPTATIVYSTTGWTSGNILATITGFSEAITGLNTGNHLFTGNEIFIFTFNDIAGNTGSVTAMVTWIDASIPSITISSHTNNQQVTGSSITLTGNLTDTISISGLYVNDFYFSGLVGGTPYCTRGDGGNGGGGGGGGGSGQRISGYNYGYGISVVRTCNAGQIGNGRVKGDRSRTMGLSGGNNNITMTGYDKAGNIIYTGITIIRIGYLSSIAATTLSATSANISFTTDVSATGYIVYGTGNLNYIQPTSFTTNHTLQLSGLAANTTYYYRVYAKNNGYTGSYSSTGSFSTLYDISTITGTTTISGEVKIGVSTGVVFTTTGTLIVGTDNYIQLNLSGFSIQTSGGMWDGNLMPPVSGTNPVLGIGGLPIDSINNGTTTTTRRILLTMQAGSDIDSLIASGGYFKLNFIVSAGTSGDELNLYRSEDGSIWTGNTPQPTCRLDANKACNFTTDHLSYFATIKETTTTNNPPSGGGGGGGGGGGLPVICTSADLFCTISGYVLKTGATCQGGNLGKVCSLIHTGNMITLLENNSQGNIIGSTFSTELNLAYLYAFQIGITTIPSILDANMTGTLIRKHLAKMISNFTIKQLKISPNTGMACTFTDMQAEDAEMKLYAKLACQLGLMGLDAEGNPISKFNPNTEVTRAQFGTVLSRALRGDKYNGGEPYYIFHLDELQNKGIMKQINTPENQELRGYVMLMLYRTTN